MSFLIPRIDSKNPKEALRAFKVAYKDDAALDAMLRRSDIVIKDEIFAYIRDTRHWRLYDTIRNDPTHPYHAEAHRILDAEKAQKDAELQAARKERFEAILQLKGKLNMRPEMGDAIKAFVRDYETTDEEKCALADCIIWEIGSWMIGNPDERRKTYAKMLSPFFCLPLAKTYLLRNSDIVFPRELAQQAADELKLNDRDRKAVYLRHRIVDGRLVTLCDVGEHEYEYVEDVWDENHEDWTRSKTRAMYRCKHCGRTVCRDK